MGNSSRHVNRKHKGTNGAVFSLCLRAPPDLDGLRMSLEQRYSRVGYVYQAICCVCVYTYSQANQYNMWKKYLKNAK